jgi:hypothetical protein
MGEILRTAVRQPETQPTPGALPKGHIAFVADRIDNDHYLPPTEPAGPEAGVAAEFIRETVFDTEI